MLPSPAAVADGAKVHAGQLGLHYILLLLSINDPIGPELLRILGIACRATGHHRWNELQTYSVRCQATL
jgi:hypothetical protein